MKRILALLIVLLTLPCPAPAETILPAGYAEGSPLPLVQAETMSFFDRVDPAWFNLSGKPSYQNASRRGRYDLYTFPDGATLAIDGSSGSALNDAAVQYTVSATRAPYTSHAILFSSFALGDYLDGCDSFIGDAQALGRTALPGLTLAQAEEAVTTLLNNLQVGFTPRLIWALDMSRERIALLGQRWNDSPSVPASSARLDYASVPADAEGFFLAFDFLLEGVPLRRASCQAVAYVTAVGVQHFFLHCPYAPGTALASSDRLLTAEAALASLRADGLAASTDSGVRLTLQYAPARDAATGGMAFTPVWRMDFTPPQGNECSLLRWAEYSAVDGAWLADSSR